MKGDQTIKGFKDLIRRAPTFKVDTEELMATIRKPYDDVVRGQKNINKVREELGIPEYETDSDKAEFKCPTCYLAYPTHASWCAKPVHIDLVKGPKVCTCGDCVERLTPMTTEAKPKYSPGTISEHRQGSAYYPEEVRTTSATGGEKGTKSERYDLIPTAPLASLARLMGKGAEKYDDHNWRKGYEFSKSYSALMRHLQTWWEGKETIDPEMGESHLAAVIFHAMVMMELEKTHPEHDDRYKE